MKSKEEEERTRCGTLGILHENSLTNVTLRLGCTSSLANYSDKPGITRSLGILPPNSIVYVVEGRDLRGKPCFLILSFIVLIYYVYVLYYIKYILEYVVHINMHRVRVAQTSFSKNLPSSKG